jgi:hypothetical protein
MRLEKSSSVVEKDSGEYSRPHCVCRVLRDEFLDQARAVDGDVDDLVLGHAEHDAAEYRRHRVIHVDDGAFGADADSTVRRISSSRAWVRTMMVTSSGMRFSSTSMRTKSKSVCEADGKPTSISLMPILHQHLEETQLLFGAHRLDQRLVAVAQVGAHPDRRLGDGLGRPLAVGQVDGGERTVFGGWDS